MKKGERLDLDKLRAQLTVAGYQHVTQVVAAGEYSVRGGLIDLFPMGTALPFRIELFDDEVETIRSFDVDSQRTLYPVPEIRLLPAREFPPTMPAAPPSASRFRETFEGDASRISLYKDVSNGITPAGIEYYLPLFFEATATLFDYLPQDAVLLLHHDVAGAIAEFWSDTQSRYNMLGGDRSRPVLPPGDLFLRDEEFFVAAKAAAVLRRMTSTLPAAEPTRRAADASASRGHCPPWPSTARADDPLAALRAFLAGHPGRTLLLAESPGRRETLAEYLAEYGLAAAPCADFAGFLASRIDASCSASARSPAASSCPTDIAVVTENELYAATARPRGRRADARRANLEGWLRDLSELQDRRPGGAREPTASAATTAWCTWTSAKATRSSSTSNTPTAPSSTCRWRNCRSSRATAAPIRNRSSCTRSAPASGKRPRRKAAEQVRDTAAELLHLYAQRALRARATSSVSSSTTWKPSPTASASRKRPTS